MKLNQITVPTRDLDLAISFYQKLGMRLIVHAPPRYARFEGPDGDFTFSLHLVDALPEGEGVSVYFELENLDAYVAELRDMGVKFDEAPEDRSWLWREARLRDPDGNRLILYFAGENRRFPPWRIQTTE